MAAIELAVKVEHGNRHTAVIHSKNVDNMTRFAKAIETTIFVKNAPSFAGIGVGGEGFSHIYHRRTNRGRPDFTAKLYPATTLRFG